MAWAAPADPDGRVLMVAGGPAAVALAEHLVPLRYADLPPNVVHRARELILDLTGVALAGSRAASTAPLHGVVRDAGPGRATVIGGGCAAPAPWAALANGSAGHAIELDDVTRESSLHPGVVVIPAALALAEELGADPGRLVAAVVAGYEVMIRVGNALDPGSTYARGFHPTGVAGAFGATAAAAHLLGLDVTAFASALGLAGTMASGSLEYLADGSWSKRLTPGWAAHAGIVAARLAARGLTGPLSALDGERGILRAYTDAPHPDRLTEGLGETFAILGVAIKPYACCRYNHGIVDAVLSLRRSGVRADDVGRMRLGILSAAMRIVGAPIERKRDPRTIVDAQFSAPYAAAVALLTGRAGVAEHSAELIAEPGVRRLLTRIECYTDPELDRSYPAEWPAEVEVVLRDGSVRRVRVQHALGEPENPVPAQLLREKFLSLAATAIPAERAARLADRILALEPHDVLDDITAEMR